MKHQRWMRVFLTSGALLTAILQAGCGEGGGSSSNQVVGPVPVSTLQVGQTETDSLTTGYDDTTQRVTSGNVVLDLARPALGNYPLQVSGPGTPNLVRAATHELLAGGYFGRGFSRFRPGHVRDGGQGEHYAGIGDIHGFQHAGDSSRMVVGMLIRFGSTFFDDQANAIAVNGDIKALVLINDSGEQPTLMTRGGITRVLGACNGNACNTTENTNVIDPGNERGNQPDINQYLLQWLWVEFQFNSNAPVFTRTRVWSEDGTLQGAEIVAPWSSAGRVTLLDGIGLVNSIPNPGAQPYYDLERVELRVGSDSNITPPTGFPGSAR